MKSVLIIEPIGDMGSILIQGLLNEGFWVTAFVENQCQVIISHERLELLEKRCWIYRDLVNAMEGHHIVLLFNTEERDYTKHEQNIRDAMAVNHIQSFMMLKPQPANQKLPSNRNDFIFLYQNNLVFDEAFKELLIRIRV